MAEESLKNQKDLNLETTENLKKSEKKLTGKEKRENKRRAKKEKKKNMSVGKRVLRILRNILITLIILIVVLCIAWKIAFPYIAPMIFDYLVDRNAEMFLKLEESLVAELDEDPAYTDTPSQAPPNTEQLPGEKPEESDAPSGETTTPSPTAEPQKPDTTIQTVHTTMGDFTGPQLVRALKNISPADKTRIIEICQNAVSMSDILTVSQILTQDGLTADQQKYIENYLRDNLSVPDKREILTILQKY